MPAIRCRMRLWKVLAHNEKADPELIYGTYDPVVITLQLQLSPLPSEPGITSAQLYRAGHYTVMAILIVNITAARYQSWSTGNRNVLILASDLERRFPDRMLPGLAWSLYYTWSVISGVARRELWKILEFNTKIWFLNFTRSSLMLFCLNMMRYSTWKILFICKLGT